MGMIARQGANFQLPPRFSDHPNAPSFPAGMGGFANRAPPGLIDLEHLSGRNILADNKRIPSSSPNYFQATNRPPAKVNPPPKVEGVTWAPFLEESTPEREIRLWIEIQEDGDEENAMGIALTSSSGLPDWEHHAKTMNGRISSYKFEWKGALKIGTKYPSNARPTDSPSAYGRGTGDDVKAGNVTLGFHESCHRNDYLAHTSKSVEVMIRGKTSAYSLPEANPPIVIDWTFKPFPRFGGKIGQHVADYERAEAQFTRDCNAWVADQHAFTERCTDQVYYTQQQYLDAAAPAVRRAFERLKKHR
jgi:hypothetical protein